MDLKETIQQAKQDIDEIIAEVVSEDSLTPESKEAIISYLEDCYDSYEDVMGEL